VILARRIGIAAAKSAQGAAIGRQEERVPGKIEIDREDRQIDAAHVADAEQDELLRERANFGMETNNLLVETFFVASVLADQNRKDRLVRAFGKSLRGGPILVPRRSLFSVLRSQQRRGEQGISRIHTVTLTALAVSGEAVC
jgi:hypothetical protein